MTQPVYPSAFPVVPPQDTAAGVAVGYPYPEPGMTLRDYFAAKAMVGYMTMCSGAMQTLDGDAHLAGLAYSLADAMMAARNTKD